MKKVSVRLPEGLADWVDEQAIAEKVERSDVFRRAVTMYRLAKMPAEQRAGVMRQAERMRAGGGENPPRAGTARPSEEGRMAVGDQEPGTRQEEMEL